MKASSSSNNNENTAKATGLGGEKKTGGSNEPNPSIESLITRLDSQIIQYREQSNELIGEVDDLYSQNLEQQQDQRQQLLHVETLNMMSKYHIVYQKMDTVLSNWAQTVKQKNEKDRLRQAFNVMKFRVKIQNKAKSFKSQLVYAKLHNKFKFLLQERSKQNFKQLSKAFNSWKLSSKVQSSAFQIQSKAQNQRDEVQNKMQMAVQNQKQRQAQIDALQRELQNDDDLIAAEQAKIEDLKQALQNHQNELSKSQKVMPPNEAPADSAAQPSSDSRVNLEADPLLDQQIQQLKNKIKRVERENVGLDERIASTNDGISNYINNMSSMLDQQSTDME